MYEQFYGLKEKPFSLTPDPEFLFMTKRHQEALDHVLYGIKRREGFTVIVGDVGTGKTTLCWALLDRLEQGVSTALILNPLMSEEDILKAILQDLGIKTRRGGVHATGSEPVDPDWMSKVSKKELIDELNLFLKEKAKEDIFTILIIDESQNLSLAALEQLRLLSNLETAKQKLLQIIFVGQLEFDGKLKLPELRQLKQRISIRFELKPLSLEETTNYIKHRLTVAGGNKRIRFTRGAYKAIRRYSKGYPRLINLICDRALLAASNDEAYLINRKLVRKGVNSLQGRDELSLSGAVTLLKRPLTIAAGLSLVLLGAVALTAFRGVIPFRSNRTQPTLPREATASERQPLDAAMLRPAAPAPTAPAPTATAPAEAAVDAKPAGPGESQPPPAAASRYYVQVHSLKTREQAESALSQLENKGYVAFIRLLPGSGAGEWFTLYVGPYNTFQDARENAVRLRTEEKLLPIIRTSQE